MYAWSLFKGHKFPFLSFFSQIVLNKKLKSRSKKKILTTKPFQLIGMIFAFFLANTIKKEYENVWMAGEDQQYWFNGLKINLILGFLHEFNKLAQFGLVNYGEHATVEKQDSCFQFTGCSAVAAYIDQGTLN